MLRIKFYYYKSSRFFERARAFAHRVFPLTLDVLVAERQIIHEHKTENFNDYTPTQNYCLQLYSCFAPSNLEELLLKYLAWKKPSICLLVINEIVI